MNKEKTPSHTDDQIIINKSEVKSFDIKYKNGIELKYEEKENKKMGFTNE
jgi:hypothetical protein